MENNQNQNEQEIQQENKVETKEEPKQEVKEETPKEKKVYNDSHTTESPYRDIDPKQKERLPDDITWVHHPAGNRDQYEGFMDKIIEEIDVKDYEKWYSSDRERQYGEALGRARFYNIPNRNIDISQDTDRYVNNVNYAGKTLGIKKVNFTSNPDEIVSNAAAIARFTSLLKVGEVMHVPLWNSGFWITITPPQQRDLINLEIQLTKEELFLGRSTQNFIYSNYSVIYTKIISEFILRNVKESTLSVPAGESLLKYISVNDLYPMILGMLNCLYPDGLGVGIFCSNNLKIGDNNEPLCQYHASIMADPIKMLMVDRERLTPEMLEQMSKRLPNSVTANQAKEYQERLTHSLDNVIKLDNNVDLDVSIRFKVPSLEDNITLGHKWVSDC